MTYLPPRKVYLLSHAVERKFITGFLDTRPEILNWYSILQGSILLVSRTDLLGLTGIIHAAYPWLHFYLVEVDRASTNGFMTPKVWEFVNNPRASGRWE